MCITHARLSWDYTSLDWKDVIMTPEFFKGFEKKAWGTPPPPPPPPKNPLSINKDKAKAFMGGFNG